MHQKSLLLFGFLLCSVPSGWKILADECIDLMADGTEVISCCQHEAMASEDSFENCFKTKDSNNSDKHVDLVMCAFDCVYREMGYIHGEDEIDVEKINTYQAGYDGAYQETIANAVNHCVTIKEEIRQHEKEHGPPTCSSLAVQLHTCIGLQVVQNCPAERWNDGPICEKIKGGTPICKL